METSIVAAGQTLQLLTFVLDDEIFAVEIHKVREVLEFHGVTRVPRVPGFMRGVINLRGNVVPVVDLKTKFGMGATEQTVNTCAIIAEVKVEGETLVLGCLADAVREVVDLDAKDVEPPPRIGTRTDTRFIKGMGRLGENFVILLDIDRIFSGRDVDSILDRPDEIQKAS